MGILIDDYLQKVVLAEGFQVDGSQVVGLGVLVVVVVLDEVVVVLDVVVVSAAQYETKQKTHLSPFTS